MGKFGLYCMFYVLQSLVQAQAPFGVVSPFGVVTPFGVISPFEVVNPPTITPEPIVMVSLPPSTPEPIVMVSPPPSIPELIDVVSPLPSTGEIIHMENNTTATTAPMGTDTNMIDDTTDNMSSSQTLETDETFEDASLSDSMDEERSTTIANDIVSVTDRMENIPNDAPATSSSSEKKNVSRSSNGSSPWGLIPILLCICVICVVATVTGFKKAILKRQDQLEEIEILQRQEICSESGKEQVIL